MLGNSATRKTGREESEGVIANAMGRGKEEAKMKQRLAQVCLLAAKDGEH